jgi:hypothetical protein
VDSEDDEWVQLAEKVDQFVDESDDDEDDDGDEEEDGADLAVVADPAEEERRINDEAIVDEIEAELEFDNNDLTLPPLTILERTQGCVLLSKVSYTL